MVGIKLEDINELCFILNELSAIAYMQRLVQYDIDEDVIYKNSLEKAPDLANLYLLEKQIKTISKFEKLLERDDFIHTIAE